MSISINLFYLGSASLQKPITTIDSPEINHLRISYIIRLMYDVPITSTTIYGNENGKYYVGIMVFHNKNQIIQKTIYSFQNNLFLDFKL